MTLKSTRPNAPHICVTTVPGSQILVRFLHDEPFRDTHFSKTGRASNDLTHVTGKSTLRTLHINTYPCVPFVCEFRCMKGHFRDTRLSKIIRQLSNEPLYTKYLPPRLKFWSLSIYDQAFSRHKVVHKRPMGLDVLPHNTDKAVSTLSCMTNKCTE